MTEENVQATTEPNTDETTPEGGSTQDKASKLDELEKDDLISIVRDLRRENAKTRTEKQATKREIEEFQKWKDSQKSELERAREETESLKQENYSLLKTSIALGAGLTLEDADFIVGDTPEEMKAAAARLAGRLKPADEKPKVTDVFAGSRGTPIGEGPKDSKTIANRYMAGLVFPR